jgi:hypothetical protein
LSPVRPPSPLIHHRGSWTTDQLTHEMSSAGLSTTSDSITKL